NGMLDPFDELADLCEEEELWLHVDGSYGAVGRLDETVASHYRGIERAHSLATDQHKWLSVPIDCGCALVRDGEILRQTFCLSESTPADLDHASDPWLSEYTFQRTRRFRAFDVWSVLCSAGRQGIAEAIAGTNRMARLLAQRVSDEPEL